MKQPKFWNTKNVASYTLKPLSWLYGAGASVRQVTTKPYHAKIPVVCVGNIVVGGAGKTPVVISLAEYFKKKKKKVHILSRGYGGKLDGVKVDLKKHTAKDVGDEPLLLAKVAPTWIYADRAKGAQAIEKTGADLILMDDGFQNSSLHKDLSLIVFDGEYGIGNGAVMPAGPLREPLQKGLKRADGVVIVGKSSLSFQNGTPVMKASITPTSTSLKGKKVIAFAGIGRPEKFFDTLKGIGAKIIKSYSFADHHPFTDKEIKKMIDELKR